MELAHPPPLFSFFSNALPPPPAVSYLLALLLFHHRPPPLRRPPFSHVLASHYRRSDVFAHPPFAPVLIIASQQPLKCHPGKVPGTDLSSTRRYFEKGRENCCLSRSLSRHRVSSLPHRARPAPAASASLIYACILFEVTNTRIKTANFPKRSLCAGWPSSPWVTSPGTPSFSFPFPSFYFPDTIASAELKIDELPSCNFSARALDGILSGLRDTSGMVGRSLTKDFQRIQNL